MSTQQGEGIRAPLLVSQAEAASSMGVSKRWLELAIARGELPTVRLGRRRLVAVADLEEFVAARRDESGSDARHE